MGEFQSGDVSIAFIDEGPREGDAILLIHGFASTKEVNWVNPGWLETLTGAGYRVIAHDNRGHGDSDKPHESDAYAPEILARDALNLLDHLGIANAHVMGYSMGARISAFAALAEPTRVRSLVFGGLGIGMVDGVGEWDPIADALLAPSINDVSHERGRMFRAFAEQTKSDRFALAACIKAARTLISPEKVATIVQPTLVAVGTKDDIAGDPHKLAALMPNAEGFDIERRDHMLAVGDKAYKNAVLKFLEKIG